ncbi:HAD family hydrolase [Falsirhodobacter halotolerans]|uniref:HAD family hydrolase n=1 Tax=Falsirhodobacter halotolerans TaxID=1146892 RepID=UPI001FD2248C|nr:HAD family hydrolase [Falsirhodobacter halotolerans]MCJ8140464.1 HAD family hydrolase [Falsirhodobacter halotolerans]
MIRGILFDKDGTLFDFQRSWGGWAAAFLADVAPDPVMRAQAARAIGYDPAAGRFAPDSPVIAETPPVIAATLLPHLPGWDLPRLLARMNALAASAPMAEAVPLAPLMADLAARGLRLGVVTNDAEAPAREHLDRCGITMAFDFIAGSDSGHGAKPDAAPLLAFCAATGLAPDQVAMVGDSLHDLEAAHAAGMVAVGVLTGPARAATLAPWADAVLDDIGQLPDFLTRHLS